MDKGAESIFWVEEFEGQLCAPSRAKRKYRSKKKEFLGWGSKRLIQFLQTIGKDTSNQLSQYGVTDIINEYANMNNLQHPQKKKRIVCDENLHSLFGRKTIGRNKIHDMLAAHFAENQQDSDDDFFYSSDEKEENALPTPVHHNFSNSERKPPRKKINLEPPKTSFAAIVPDNIKLVYLRKSVVMDLLKDLETFEDKIKGSFIRIKSDPNDFLQKNSHRLLQVTGVKKASGTDDISEEILLQVSNSIKDVHICMLSDDNFSEEECKDLHQRMKDGLLKRPTIGDLEGKAQILHVDITKHDDLFNFCYPFLHHVDLTQWLSRELDVLQNQIDRANEKGWRKEVVTLYEYLERRKLLQTPSEQTRLLSEVPKVVGEEMEVAAKEDDLLDNVEQELNASPRSILMEASETPVCQVADNVTIPTCISPVSQNATFIEDEQKQPEKMLHFGKVQQLDEEECNGSHGTDKRIMTFAREEIKQPEKTLSFDQISFGKMQQLLDVECESFQGMDEKLLMTQVLGNNGSSQALLDKPVVTTQLIELEGSRGMDKQVVTTPVIERNGSQSLDKKTVVTEVIDLSDDDDEENENPRSTSHIPPREHPGSVIWLYADPQGDVQGPFSMILLKQWSDANYFPPGFKVWKLGQTKNEAVLLSHILQIMFTNGF